MFIEPLRAETFCITTEPNDDDSGRASRRLTAEGDLTELGGELAFDAVRSLLEIGVRNMTMDLSRLTSIEDVGLRWLRRAWLQADRVGACLWTVGVADEYRGLVPVSPPHDADAVGTTNAAPWEHRTRQVLVAPRGLIDLSSPREHGQP